MDKVNDKIRAIVHSVKQWRLPEWIACGVCVVSIVGAGVAVDGFMTARSDYEASYPTNQATIKQLESDLAAFDSVVAPTLDEVEAITISAYKKGMAVAQLQNEYHAMIRMDTTLTDSAKADMKVKLKQNLMDYFDPDSAAGYDEWFILPNSVSVALAPTWTFMTDVESTSNTFKVIWLMTEKASDSNSMGDVVAYTVANYVVEDKTKPEEGRFYDVKTTITNYGKSKYMSDISSGANAPTDDTTVIDVPNLDADSGLSDVIQDEGLTNGFENAVMNRGDALNAQRGSSSGAEVMDEAESSGD